METVVEQGKSVVSVPIAMFLPQQVMSFIAGICTTYNQEANIIQIILEGNVAGRHTLPLKSN